MNVFWELIRVLRALAVEIHDHRDAVRENTEALRQLTTATLQLAAALGQLTQPPTDGEPAYAKITVGVTVPE
jgi:hypothetical protein